MSVLIQDADLAIHVGDALDVLRSMPDGSVNCCVTSPPYWGLRDYGAEGQLGLEATPEEYVASMVAVFREVRRVLADTGTLWLNLGDSYAAQTNGGPAQSEATTMTGGRKMFDLPARERGVLKHKDLIGIPWRVALALQADGWYLRSDIIWSKPNPMPESVTDRPTKAHEYVFLLSKGPQYWFDQEAVREPHSQATLRQLDYELRAGVAGRRRIANAGADVKSGRDAPGSRYGSTAASHNEAGRNIRSVWEIATQPYAEAHFATFPEELARRCILAGCPEWVCGSCGKPRERVTDGASYYKDRDTSKPEQKYAAVGGGHGGVGRGPKSNLGSSIAQTVGWSDCGHGNYRPGTVLDPFGGSGTVGLVARKHGRRAVLIELNPEYAALAAQRCQQLSLFAEIA